MRDRRGADGAQLPAVKHHGIQLAAGVQGRGGLLRARLVWVSGTTRVYPISCTPFVVHVRTCIVRKNRMYCKYPVSKSYSSRLVSSRTDVIRSKIDVCL